MEMIFGNFVIWIIGAVVIGTGWIAFFLIRMDASIHDPFVKHTVIVFEFFWLIAVLINIFFPEFYSFIGNL